MLDSDLAETYGYETKSFDRQVKNNMEKFDEEDFMFWLTKEELLNLRCKNFASIMQTKGIRVGEHLILISSQNREYTC